MPFFFYTFFLSATVISKNTFLKSCLLFFIYIPKSCFVWPSFAWSSGYVSSSVPFYFFHRVWKVHVFPKFYFYKFIPHSCSVLLFPSQMSLLHLRTMYVTVDLFMSKTWKLLKNFPSEVNVSLIFSWFSYFPFLRLFFRLFLSSSSFFRY